MANSESHFLEIPVCRGTFFIPEKIEKSKKIFLIVAKPATVDCENRAIEGKGGEKFESNRASPSVVGTFM